MVVDIIQADGNWHRAMDAILRVVDKGIPVTFSAEPSTLVVKVKESETKIPIESLRGNVLSEIITSSAGIVTD